MKTEIIKTTIVTEKKLTYDNGFHVLYALKDNDLYSYSFLKDGLHYSRYLKDFSELENLTMYEVVSYFEKSKLSLETEEDILCFNDFSSLYCVPENVVRDSSGNFLNFSIDLKGIHFYPSQFKATFKAVELFSKYLQNSPFVQLTSSLVVGQVPHYNQNTYDNFTSYHITKGLLKFSDEFFKKSIKQSSSTFYVSVGRMLQEIESIFVENYKQELEEIYKKEFGDLF